MENDPIINQAIQFGIKYGIEAWKNERNANLKNKKILICQSDAEERLGSGVLKNLLKRKLVFPYQFGVEEVVDEEGQPIKKAKGYIYYKLSDLVEAIEKGNNLLFNSNSGVKDSVRYPVRYLSFELSRCPLVRYPGTILLTT